MDRGLRTRVEPSRNLADRGTTGILAQYVARLSALEFPLDPANSAHYETWPVNRGYRRKCAADRAPLPVGQVRRHQSEARTSLGQPHRR